MPDYKDYKERVKFLISNRAETATTKVNDFLDTINADDVIMVIPMIVPIGSPDRKAYLVGAMVRYWEKIEPQPHLN